MFIPDLSRPFGILILIVIIGVQELRPLGWSHRKESESLHFYCSVREGKQRVLKSWGR